MANTYTQLYIHIVFSVKNRLYCIKDTFKDELLKYMTGIIKNQGNQLIAINSAADHVHIFTALNPKIAISSLVHDIKLSTSEFIKEKKFVPGKFYWQEGFGAFSYSHSHVKYVVHYIQNQEQHHKNVSFREEYSEMLKKFNVVYNEEYAFDID